MLSVKRLVVRLKESCYFYLIPALVDAVKGYMDYEKSLLKEITKLRIRALSDNLTDEERVRIDFDPNLAYFY